MAPTAHVTYDRTVSATRPAPTVFNHVADGAACAPGRVNLIGEHTDYNGGLVLPLALGLATQVAVRWRDDGRVRGRSQLAGEQSAALADGPAATWLDHVRGVARVGASDGRWPARGFDVEVRSDVPAGAGLASSAALGVATACALAAAAGDPPCTDDDRARLALVAHEAEHDFVGVPCGTMDQLVSACARADHALLIDCRTGSRRPLALPRGIDVVVIDTGVRRALADGRYAERRQWCERALVSARTRLERTIPDLSALTPADLAGAALRDLAPAERQAAEYVARENARVRRVVDALDAGDTTALGPPLYESHDDLRERFGATWPEADVLIDASRGTPGVLGARMTGAGWGGCTVHLLAAHTADLALERLIACFAERFGRRPSSWRTTAGPGARLL